MSEHHDNDTLSQRTKRPGIMPATWGLMTFYERFEHIVVMVLSFIISIVVLFALFQLGKEVYNLLILKALHPLNHEVFQSIFGMIMTLLIAMEFKHSMLRVLERNSHIVQTKTVILIALLALTRKFIIVDMEEVGSDKLIALGLSVFLLCAGYYLLNLKKQTLER